LTSILPTGRALFQIAGAFAELERAAIRERVIARLARAKAQGTELGRKREDGTVERKIEYALSRGDRGIQKRDIGVCVGTVPPIKAAMTA
jgi:DNA invertase Pin-like site-specific DNA recombinase